MDDNFKSAYIQRHKQACIEVYKLISSLWPPDNSVEYWERAAQAYSDVNNRNLGNPLCRALLVATYNCLGFTVTDDDVRQLNDSNHKTAFRVVLDLANDIVTNDKLHQAPEIIDITRGAYPDNKLLLSMLDGLAKYLETVREEQ